MIFRNFLDFRNFKFSKLSDFSKISRVSVKSLEILKKTSISKYSTNDKDFKMSQICLESKIITTENKKIFSQIPRGRWILSLIRKSRYTKTRLKRLNSKKASISSREMIIHQFENQEF